MNYRTAIAILGSIVLLLPLAAMWWPRGQAGPGFAAAAPIGWQPFVASLVVAALAAALATVIGGAMAVLFSLTDLPGSTLWATIAILAFACPATVWALAQVYCYGPGGLVERWLG